MKIKYLIGLVLCALALNGCATAPTPESIATFIGDARDIAELGTQAALLENPKLRTDLEITRKALAEFEALPDGKISTDELVRVLTSLPLDGLQSPKGRIYTTGGRIIVRRFVSWVSKPEIDVGESGYIRQFAKALGEGMDLGLK